MKARPIRCKGTCKQVLAALKAVAAPSPTPLPAPVVGKTFN